MPNNPEMIYRYMKFKTNNIRNIAIIAHVDHGKTTLVDKMLQQSGTFKEHEEIKERVLDSNDLEKERGITILSKNTGIIWNDCRINIIDTPGHADFGGEVERILSMADSALLLVDAVEGPMPQTTFVLKKALKSSLEPIVVINKIDRDGARPDWVLDKTFDLFVDLKANEKQLDFPIIYASALNGWSSLDYNIKTESLKCLFDIIVEKVPSPINNSCNPLQMQITALDYSNYLGMIGIGKIENGNLKKNQVVSVIERDGNIRNEKISKIMVFQGLSQIDVNEAYCGDIVALNGLGDLKISDTICDIDKIQKMPNLQIDEPTLSMVFQVNDSPLSGSDGKFITSRNLKDRLDKELKTNVALKVETTDDADKFKVSGRGELHLSILIENMRREGFEVGISSPDVIYKIIDSQKCEPFEDLTLDIEDQYQGIVIEKLGERKAQLINLIPKETNKVRLNYEITTRGLIGFRSEFLTLTSGSGLINHTFKEYKPVITNINRNRKNGALISMSHGKAVSYALHNLQQRGKLIINGNDEIYEGMIIGFNSRDEDLTVNPLKSKQLTNFRANGSDDSINLVPPLSITLEKAIEIINDDELIEVTPNNIRLRKKFLKEHERKKNLRAQN